MRLTNLRLESFRNYQSLELEIPQGVQKVVLVGENGQGKTNLLESIYILSVAKSFRTKRMKDLIKWDADYTRIHAGLERKDDPLTLEVFLSQPQKATKKNAVILPSHEFIGQLNAVLFHPQDMNMLLMSPDLRRKYINLVASQTSQAYLQALMHYSKVLKNRNRLLMKIQAGYAKEDECFFWDQELVRSGSLLVNHRHQILEHFNQKLSQLYQSISGGKEKVKIKYKSFINDASDLSEVELSFSTKLLEKKNSDLRYGYTSIGPHRDDLVFLLNGKEVEHHGSRGECRTLLIALKLAEIEYISETTGSTPILLLDDVFSELDEKRQEYLLKSIDQCQTFITTTAVGDLNSLKGIMKLNVANGALE